MVEDDHRQLGGRQAAGLELGDLGLAAHPEEERAGASASTTPAASLARLLSSVIGAPRSKISRYGPLPLIFASTSMWLVGSISNGTTAFAAFGLASAVAGAVAAS